MQDVEFLWHDADDNTEDEERDGTSQPHGVTPPSTKAGRALQVTL